MVSTVQVPIPAGRYDAKIIGSRFKGVATGPRIDLDVEIIGGAHDGRVIVKELHLHSSKSSVQQQARAELSSICLAVGVLAPKNIADLYDIPMAIQVGADKQRNTILAFSSLRQQCASASPGPRRLQLTRAADIEVRPPDWLLRGMLERDSFALVFGDPGCGKSFLAIDWACRIATGTPWRGHAVKAGPVVYIAGEGQSGFGRRIRAWQQYNDVSLDEKPLYLSPAVAMPDPADLVALVTAIDTGVAAVGGMPAMIVLDTLARNFGSGDESSTQDMTRFVASCDVIRKRYGCTVLVVHHTGHADKSRARGAMALKAALDAEYRLEQTAKHEGLLTATKMKDAEEPDPMGLSLVTVELSGLVDDYGNPVTSAAVEVATADIKAIAAQAETARRRGKWQKHGLDIAKRLAEQSETGWVDVFEWRSASGEAGMSRQTQLRVLETMAEYGEIVRHGDRIRLPNDD